MSIISKLKKAAIAMARTEVEKHALAQAKEQERYLVSDPFLAEVREAQLSLRERPDAMEAKIQNDVERDRTELTYYGTCDNN